jgi:hypothetical protein
MIHVHLVSLIKPQRAYLGYKVYDPPLDVNILQRNRMPRGILKADLDIAGRFGIW